MSSLSEKVFVLGVDGMDPRMTKKYLDAGKMPHLAEFIKRGSCREDLVMLGGVPTITPPMWTTLATGANPSTHGITCFWGQDPVKLDTLVYNMDSERCKAEQMWNVTALAGKKTLVWHWPGGAWPPSLNNENLHVVDGAQPAVICMGSATVDGERLCRASVDTPELKSFSVFAAADTGAGCIIKDLSNEHPAEEDDEEEGFNLAGNLGSKTLVNIELSVDEGEAAGENAEFDTVDSPLVMAHDWDFAVSNGAKEFVLLTSNGLVRRYGLVEKNAAGEYDKVSIYKNKKENAPLCVLTRENNFVVDVIDEVMAGDNKFLANRIYSLVELDAAGTNLCLWMSLAIDINNKEMFWPHSLHDQAIAIAGQIPTASMNGANGKDDKYVEAFSLNCWEHYCDWQAKVLLGLVHQNGYEVVYSHLHNIDCMGHGFWGIAMTGNEHVTPEQAQYYIEKTYIDTDNYIGALMELLDEDWSIIITSDHGLLVRNEEMFPAFGDPFGVNAKIMYELGYTALKKDKNGKLKHEIDWEHTTAVASRGNHVYINLKGRNPYGIVDPADKYALEEKIITDLYNLRTEEGNRMISVVLRNKEAALVGMDGPECGDLIYWLAEGPNRVHGDSLSTYYGLFDSSVSPIFVAAGKGIKEGFTTERVIRSIDVTPTVAALLGMRMPAQAEGAPVYQILEK